MFSKVKKLIATGILSAIVTGMVAGCGNNAVVSDAPVLNNESVLNSFAKNKVDSDTPFKLGMIVDNQTPKVAFDAEESIVQRNAGIPKKVDWRQYASPVANQGELGSCTGFAIVKGLREFLLIRDKKPLVKLSPLFMYYNERKLEGRINEDSGARISTGMKLLKDIGTATDTEWPYVVESFKDSPTREAFSSASDFRVKDIKRLEGLRDIKYALAKKNPVALGIVVLKSVFTPVNGKVALPNLKEQIFGGHAVFCVGYDDNEKVLIIKNSWGTNWGDKGYFYLPYEYVKQGLVMDAWTAYTN